MPAPIIQRLSPASGWPGGTASDGTSVDGTLIIIHGRYFHPTAEMHRNEISFTASSGGRVPAPVVWASINEVDYQPNGIVASDSSVPGGLNGPAAVAVNSNNGDLYIANTANNCIIRKTASGTFTSWGASGSGNGQFNQPTGIDVDHNGNVYVADTMNHRIQKFNANGGFITAWGSHGSGIGQFDMPVDVDVALIGGMTMVYVADSNNHRVARSDENGNMPTQLVPPADAGRILGVSAPRGYGFVYATDPANKRIYRWAWHGPFNGYFGAPGPHNLALVEVGFPMGIEQDFDGYVYISDNSGRVIRKFDPFDPNFREISKFGLTVPTIPGPTPAEEFVDPVDVAVTDLKSVYVVDRARKQVVRYTPTDSQELWVHVPAGAVTGNIRVRTDDGEDSMSFFVLKRAQVEVADAYLTQGLSQYPLVAGKRTIIRYQMRTVGESSLGKFSWGSPVHDSAICHVFKDGTEVGQIQGEVEYLTDSGGFMSFQPAFEIRFEIPHWIINDQANYRFRVTIQRSGTPAFNDTRDFPNAAGTVFHNRKSYRIVASPVTHLRHDGNRVSDSDMWPALFYVGNNVGHMVDWVDWSQLYSGYAHYNRIYPLRYSVANIVEWGIWVNGTMHNGINSDDEVRAMLQVLEYTRRDINEDSGLDYDFMLGIIDRNEVAGDWIGITSDAYRSALISVGNDQSGDPAYDVGAIIAHELLHQHNLHHQSERELAVTDKQAWNSISGNFINNPVTLRYVPPSGGFRTQDWNDETAFAEGRHNGTDGSYDEVYDALSNPHPVAMRVRERALKNDERPADTPHNFTLIGHYSREKGFTRTSSWIGRGDAPVTPEVPGGEGELLFTDGAGHELMRWRLRFSFGLRTIDRSGQSGNSGEDTATISVTCPFPATTAHVALLLDKQEVWHADLPTEQPTVKLIAPTGGQHIAPTDTVIVEWQASHPQGLELEYAISYSGDGGETFRPIAVGIKNSRYEGQLGLGASSGSIRIRVVASDGFNRVHDTSDDISVDDAARRIVIIQPHRGQIIPEGKKLRLTAIANDLEQGSIALTAGNTLWRLNDEVILGNGNDIDISKIELTTPRGTVVTPLPVGAHRLTVEVTLSAGHKLTDEIPIEIAADSDRDGIPDDVEIEGGTDPNDPGNRSSIAPIYPFGQWRFRRCCNYTLFQISHLLTGHVSLQLGFIDEQGQPLSHHPIDIVYGTARTTLNSDAEGWIPIELGSLQSVLVRLAADQAGRKHGFGSCRLRVANRSALDETKILAHAWVSRKCGFWWLGRDSQGTIVINGGNPLAIRGTKTWKGSSPNMIVPMLGFRLLGRLQMATQRLSKQGGDITHIIDPS